VNTELEMTLRVWHSAHPFRSEHVRYDKLRNRYTVRLEQDGRTVATGQARERDEAFARAVAQLAPDEPRSNRRVEQRRAEIRRMSEELRNLRVAK
jgi:hypothetical protein